MKQMDNEQVKKRIKDIIKKNKLKNNLDMPTTETTEATTPRNMEDLISKHKPKDNELYAPISDSIPSEEIHYSKISNKIIVAYIISLVVISYFFNNTTNTKDIKNNQAIVKDVEANECNYQSKMYIKD